MTSAMSSQVNPSPVPTAAETAAPESLPVRPRVESTFVESTSEEDIPAEILTRRLCDFDLRIEGRPLEKILARFREELAACGIRRLQPAFYLTDEWGVPEGTVAIGIPFYLADPELLRVQTLKGGFVEGESEDDILRYLRHEMGHVVNYAYRLYATEEWTKIFGPMSRPYTEEYHVVPFSTDFVRHLPGGYAQKHPDEDWAETFALWMTPGSPWRELYGDSPGALAKLEYCDRTIAALRERDPDVTSTQLDYEAREMQATVQEYYEEIELGDASIPRSLDGDLQVIFARRAHASEEAARSGDAAALLKRQQDSLVKSVYRWTGADPDVLYQLVGHLGRRARALKISYALAERDAILVELSGFLTTLAMNYIYTGKFIAS
jgi:hypothetical protein